MSYGLKIKDGANELLVTPDITTLYDGGRATMPSSGSNGNAYGKNISITSEGQSGYSQGDIGILAASFIINTDIHLYVLNYDGWYFHSWFFNNAYSFFTRNENNGVLTTWTPDKSSPTNFDGLLSVFPLAFWDRRGATSFTSVEIFAATTYLGYDQSASSFKTVYTVGSQGVEKVDYVIFLRRFKG